MSETSPVFKAQAINQAINAGKPLSETAEALGMDAGTIMDWVREYRRRQALLGKTVAQPKHVEKEKKVTPVRRPKRERYTNSFKNKCLKAVRDNPDKTQVEIAAEMGVSDKTLSGWIIKDRAKKTVKKKSKVGRPLKADSGLVVPAQKSRLELENAMLRKENALLREMLDFYREH